MVSSRSSEWRQIGVGSDDASALVGAAFSEEDHVLALWARIVGKNELKEIKRMKKITDMAQGTSEWLQWRMDGIGGSEVAAIVGAEYKRKENRADTLWAKKLPETDPNWVGEKGQNPNMKWGSENEPNARNLYESLYGWSLTPVCVVDDQHSFLRCSLDGIRADDQLIGEIKCPRSPRIHSGYVAISKIDDPLERQTALAQHTNYYRYQILYQLLVSGAKSAHFISYYPEWEPVEDRLVVSTIYPEPDQMELLRQRAIEFWDFVVRREPPPKEWLVPVHSLPSVLAI